MQWFIHIFVILVKSSKYGPTSGVSDRVINVFKAQQLGQVSRFCSKVSWSVCSYNVYDPLPCTSPFIQTTTKSSDIIFMSGKVNEIDVISKLNTIHCLPLFTNEGAKSVFKDMDVMGVSFVRVGRRQRRQGREGRRPGIPSLTLFANVKGRLEQQRAQDHFSAHFNEKKKSRNLVIHLILIISLKIRVSKFCYDSSWPSRPIASPETTNKFMFESV